MLLMTHIWDSEKIGEKAQKCKPLNWLVLIVIVVVAIIFIILFIITGFSSTTADPIRL